MSKRANPEVADVTASICGALSDLGYQYTWSADNRGGNRSRYVFITKPVAAKIRISDHPSDRIEKDKSRSRMAVFDVGLGRHGLTWENALASIVGLAEPNPPKDRP